MAELRAYTPSLREKLAWGLAGGLGKFGADKHTQQWAADKVGGLIDFVPGVGEVLGIDDAWRDARAGNYGMAAAGLGLTAVGAVPGVGDAVANAGRKGIRAFHGSPHDFTRFDISKMGSGEGAQAYGHGLYFAENEAVARSYRDDLTADISDPAMTASRILELHGGRQDAALDYATKRLEDAYARGDMEAADRAMAIRAAMVTPENLPSTQGHMYEVNINARPEQFIDWSEDIAPVVKSDAGIESLKQDGYVGVRYPDAGSRGADGSGTNNYVVFDDSLIEIVKKYGLAGAVSAGLISQEMAAQMQAQGEI